MAWHGDQAMGCCGCGGSGLCGCVGGRRSENVDRVRVAWCGVAWLDAPAWVSLEREAVTWSKEIEREQRNEVRERADTFR